MRILFISAVGTIGGAERVLLDLIASIHGHDMHALLMEDGPLANALRAAGATVHVQPAAASIISLGDSAAISGSKAGLIGRGILAAPAVWNYLRRLRRALRRITPDVIHSNGLKSHLLLGLARVRQPTVWHIHDFVGDRPLIAGL